MFEIAYGEGWRERFTYSKSEYFYYDTETLQMTV